MPKIVWLPASIVHFMKREADKFYDFETGGTYMGYWATESEAVVTHNIPAGPRASHQRNHFEPDQAWQIGEIERHYYESGRLDTYLGDWHTHPDATHASLSWADIACLKRIIKTPEARQHRPIMLLVTGRSGDWAFTPKICHLKPILFFFNQIEDENAELRIFG